MKGQNVGRLDLHVVGDSLAFTDRGERAEIETILADHRRQLTEYDRRLGETDPATMRDYYEQRRKEIEAAIARETALLQSLPAAITGSWFENRDHPAGRGHARPAGRRDPRRRLQQGEREARGGRQAGGPRHRGAPPQTGAAAPRRPPAGGTYIGTATCGGCHAPALAFWKTTKHARALSALERIGRDKDPSCVGCHVTGYLQPGGPTDVAEARAALRQCGVRGLPRRREASMARPSTSAGRWRAPSRRRPAAAATPPTSPAATSTTRSSCRRSSDPGTRGARAGASSIVPGSNDDLPRPRARGCLVRGDARALPPRPLTPRAPASRRWARGPSRRATSPRYCRRSSNAATARRATSTARAARRPRRTCARRCRGVRSRSRPTNRAWSRCPITTRR